MFLLNWSPSLLNGQFWRHHQHFLWPRKQVMQDARHWIEVASVQDDLSVSWFHTSRPSMGGFNFAYVRASFWPCCGKPRLQLEGYSKSGFRTVKFHVSSVLNKVPEYGKLWDALSICRPLWGALQGWTGPQSFARLDNLRNESLIGIQVKWKRERERAP